MVFVMIVGAVLQAVIPSWTHLGDSKAPILLGIVLYYALTRERNAMLRAAIFAGVLQDALGMSPLGYSSFCFCIAGLATNRFKDIVFGYRAVTHMMFGALGYLITTLMMSFLLSSTGFITPYPQWVILKCAGSLVLGAIAVPFVFRAVEDLDRFLGNMEADAY